MFQWLPFSFKAVPTLFTLSCRALPDLAMPWHLPPFLPCSLPGSKAHLFFSVCSASCPIPAILTHLEHCSHATSPAGLLCLQAPCPGWDESLNGNLYYTVSLLMTSLVTLPYISLSLLHQFLENSSADCYCCLLCGYHRGLQVFNKQELKSTFYKCDLFPVLGTSLSLMGFLAVVVISHQHFAECSLHIIHSLCILNT